MYEYDGYPGGDLYDLQRRKVGHGIRKTQGPAGSAEGSRDCPGRGGCGCGSGAAWPASRNRVRFEYGTEH